VAQFVKDCLGLGLLIVSVQLNLIGLRQFILFLIGRSYGKVNQVYFTYERACYV